jgi:hypothetical protein
MLMDGPPRVLQLDDLVPYAQRTHFFVNRALRQ